MPGGSDPEAPGASDPGGPGTAARAASGPPPSDLRTADFAYDLPEGLIARHPAARRDGSRLLALDGETGEMRDLRFRDLADLVTPGDALVLNDSRVFPARLRGRKPTGAAAEILLLEPAPGAGAGGAADRADPGVAAGGPDAGRPGPSPGAEDLRPSGGEAGPRVWRALVRPGGKLKPGRRVVVGEGLEVAILDSTPGGGRIVRLEGEEDPWTLIERHGQMPIPPYLEREPEAEDRERYQTVYAERTGSVAAPTAGLHFTPELLEELEGKGVEIVRLTLHVGIGTFRPVEAERPEDHQLHSERYTVTEEAAARLNRVRSAGGRIWAVGTTSTRTLETVTDAGGRVHPGSGETELFIRPPYRFRAVDRLITNFHLPRSSLLMLVSALAGRERVLEAYRHAIERGYRFYSYGDAMVVL